MDLLKEKGLAMLMVVIGGIIPDGDTTSAGDRRQRHLSHRDDDAGHSEFINANVRKAASESEFDV